jgi:hypothetical protein
MSSTKIINVLKDDSFQEILDLFKGTSADEVIFVLPKRSRAFQAEEHFASLKTEAKDLGKSVSFLCSSPELNELAKKYKFDVLLARAPVARKTTRTGKTSEDGGSINVVNQIEEFYSEPTRDPDSISIQKPAAEETVEVEKEEEPEDGLDFEEESVPVHSASLTGRRLDDVLVPDDDDQHSVKVSGSREKEKPVEVRTAAEFTVPKKKEPKISAAGPSFAARHRRAFMAGGVAVVLLGGMVVMTTGKAQVNIKPADKPLDLRLDIFTSDNIPSIDPVKMSLPGQVFNIQKTVSQDFPATGHVDVAQKARGTLTVYNELTSTQPLVATTRFESADHHIFHTMTSIVVPASKTVNGKLVPGNIDVQVIADKPGADYNVPVGIFTVPAFKEKGDTEKFQKVYAQSTDPIHSGTSGQSTVVTDSDLAAAKQALQTTLVSSIHQELQSQMNGLKIINDDQIISGQPTSTTPADVKATTFTASLTGSLKTVGFKPSDLDTLIKNYVDTHNNLAVLPEKLTLAYENIRWDSARNGLSFTIHVTGPGYTKIDEQRIISDLLGKNDAQIKAYLGSILGISEAKVSLSPFWVRSIPNNESRVQVDVTY